MVLYLRKVIYWAQLFHLYQPPTQSHDVLFMVCQESYHPLLQVLEENPHARATVNICGVLTQMLAEHGRGDILEGLRGLAERGQIEFTGSAMYHPILPLIPKREIERQIMQNRTINQRFLVESFSPKGFFPPELCYSEDIVEPVIKTGHQWIILSGVACPIDWTRNLIYEVEFEGEGLAVLFRDDILSNKIGFASITGERFLKEIKQLSKGDAYLITALDGETFGHHIKNWEREFLDKVYQGLRESKGVRMVKLSELLDLFPRGGFIKPFPSSWSTTKEDIAQGKPYPLWDGNKIHKLQWEHLNICLDMTERALAWADSEKSKKHALLARHLLDPALHSCQFWWASGEGRWDINLVHKGLLMQREVVLNAFQAIIESKASEEGKREAYYRFLASGRLADKIIDELLTSGK